MINVLFISYMLGSLKMNKEHKPVWEDLIVEMADEGRQTLVTWPNVVDANNTSLHDYARVTYCIETYIHTTTYIQEESKQFSLCSPMLMVPLPSCTVVSGPASTSSASVC